MAMGSLLKGHAVQRVEDAVRARVDGERGAEAPGDHALLVDDKQGPLGDALALTIGAVGSRHLALGLEIGEEWEMQVAILRERLVTPRAIHGNTQELGGISGRTWL